MADSRLDMRGSAAPPLLADPAPGLPTPPPPPGPPAFAVDTSGRRPIFYDEVAPPPAALPPPDATGTIDVAGLLAKLRQVADTGSQGSSVRSNAADIASRSDRISRILEKQLEEATRPGFGDIIASAMDTLAGQGRVSFAGALAQREGQELTRAYNIANALSGLQQRRNQEQLVEVALPGGQKIQVSGAAALNYLKENKSKNPEAMQALNLLERASRQFADPPAAMAVMAGVLAEKADPTTPASQAMADVLNDPRVASRPRRADKTGEADSETMGGFSEYAEGVPAKFVPYRGRLTVQQEAQNNAYRVAGGGEAGTASAFAVAQGQVEKGAPSIKSVADYKKQAIEVGVASDLINRSRELLKSDVNTGLAAVIVQTAAGTIDQARQLLGKSTIMVNNEDKRIGTFDVANLSDKLGVESEFEAMLSKVPGMAGGLQELAQKSGNAQAFKTNMILLTYSVAKAMDPAGRLSDRDVAAVARALGQGMLGDRGAQSRALDEIENSLRSRITRAYAANQAALEKAGVKQFEFKAAPAASKTIVVDY